ncbi:vacuolar protein sorting-associated protein 52 homolog isoform X2 [Gordionus sp. m RMFG-2023]|uniref:vacuolar protein sorting-associated protein 52 homolog isoform X2 n=1 Tax=Gordionus sp. m RMFG-2023 TaxID=3053472 RepID=UPI0031FC9D18
MEKLKESSTNNFYDFPENLLNTTLKDEKDLRLYSKDIEKELNLLENDSLQQYIKHGSSFLQSYKEISECDETLASIQSMLENFQNNLEKICSEIQDLQSQSQHMKIKLKNRQDAKCELSQLVDEIIISEDVINTIMDIDVSEPVFQESLHELHHKLNFLQKQCYEEGEDTKAFQDIKQILEKLKIRAISKIKDFLLKKIYSFRKPMTNYQVPQSYLLKYRFFYEFLMHNDRHTAIQIKEEYVDTLNKILYAYFKDYYVKLIKLQYEEVPTKDDLIGEIETNKKSIFNKSLSMKDSKSNNALFTLGKRAEILGSQEILQPIIVPHIASQQNKKKSLDTYTATCYDSIGLLLCIHLVYRFYDIEHKRDMSFLAPYWYSVLEALNSRFIKVFEMNINSMKEIDVSKLQGFDLRPHYITRRFAEFASSILSVNQSFSLSPLDEDGPSLTSSGPDNNHITRQLTNELRDLLLKMASSFYSRKERLVFLLNNYDLAYTIIWENLKRESCCETLKSSLASWMDEFAEEILSPYFGGMISLVREIESSADDPQVVWERLKAKTNLIRAIIKFFNEDRSKAIEAMNSEIMQSFTNFKNGTNVLQVVLSKLIQYYHRFCKILNHPVLKNVEGRSELINTHNLMVEMKKYKTNF